MKNNQAIQLKRDQQIVVGIDEEMPTTMNLHIGGEAYTTEALAAVIQQRIDAANELFAARTRLQCAQIGRQFSTFAA